MLLKANSILFPSNKKGEYLVTGKGIRPNDNAILQIRLQREHPSASFGCFQFPFRHNIPKSLEAIPIVPDILIGMNKVIEPRITFWAYHLFRIDCSHIR